jgi:outer membrane protein assembly factor BamB
MREPAGFGRFAAVGCAVSVTAGLLLAACTSDGGSNAPSRRPSPTRNRAPRTIPSLSPQPVLSPSPGPASGPTRAARPIGFWHGRQLGRVRVEAGSLAAIGARLYATSRPRPGPRLVLLDPRTGAVRARSAPVRFSGYGLAPPVGAGGLIWTQGASSAQLLGLDPNSGAVLATDVVGEPSIGLQATAGGLWSTVAGGHEARIGFRPAIGSAPPGELGAGTSGGGFDVLPTISGGVEWLGGYGAVGCADPDTGEMRARATTPARPPAYLSAITVADGHVYALYGLGDRSRLISLRPPAACGIR